MADRLAGGNLADTIRTLTDEGLSPDGISRRLFADHGIDVSGRTVARWLPVLVPTADDGPEAYTRKIFGSTIASLDSACQSLDPQHISRAVDLLIQARQIHFFGLGASASVALDAQHKFFRFNLAVSAHSDVLMQRMIASVAHTGDLFVIISYTGRTRELVEVARLARENGASVLGLTAAGSPLAKASTLSLDIPLPEDTDIYMPMTSRIIQLTVLDVLATGVTLRRGVDFQPHLRRIKESLSASRYPADEEPL